MGTEHFDSKAADWDKDPAKVSRAQEIGAAVAESVPLAPGTRLLEYGAGTGLVTQALRDRVGQVVLADNSAGMRQVIEEKIAAGLLPDAVVWNLDLERHPVPDEQFDLVVTALVLHHVRDLPTVLSGFAALLRPGGHLCIADLDREDGSFHQHDFDGHHGFDRTDLSEALRAAGFAEVRVEDCTTIFKEGASYQVFLATAMRS
ncbi:methyltransferase domain-containing protein [Ornithinimicrobium sp. F0845]|uniref:class I SAM-dependent methyltransferase n=1 Tax=Ornithinimicrobium sp. F0845 TaxID=2926412 RepID=UPI001FF542B5|nr:methyltransferase domain-containing protein [Ornithinimicrobium sp. F0845]MCK0111458.1 methyltransferase domain-containing protein [Ornithinimicrobium sp. F0845]